MPGYLRRNQTSPEQAQNADGGRAYPWWSKSKSNQGRARGLPIAPTSEAEEAVDGAIAPGEEDMAFDASLDSAIDEAAVAPAAAGVPDWDVQRSSRSNVTGGVQKKDTDLYDVKSKYEDEAFAAAHPGSSKSFDQSHTGKAKTLKGVDAKADIFLDEKKTRQYDENGLAVTEAQTKNTKLTAGGGRVDGKQTALGSLNVGSQHEIRKQGAVSDTRSVDQIEQSKVDIGGGFDRENGKTDFSFKGGGERARSNTIVDQINGGTNTSKTTSTLGGSGGIQRVDGKLSGQGSAGYKAAQSNDRSTDIDGVKLNDHTGSSFASSGNLQRKDGKTAYDGKVALGADSKRSTSQVIDGQTVGTTVSHAGNLNAAHGKTLEGKTSTSVGGDYKAAIDRTRSFEEDGGTTELSRGASGGIQGNFSRADGKNTANGVADLALSGGKKRTTEIDGGTRLVDRGVSGDLKGTIATDADGKKSGGLSGGVTGHGQVTDKTIADNGDRVSLTRGGELGVNGGSSWKDGKRTDHVGGHLGANAARTIETDIDNGTRATTNSAKGVISGTVARDADGKRTGVIDATLDARRQIVDSTELDGVSTKVTKGGDVALNGGSSWDAEGKRTDTAGARIGLDHTTENTSAIDNGTVTSKVGHKGGISGDVTRRDGKYSGQAGVDYALTGSKVTETSVNGVNTRDALEGTVRAAGGVEYVDGKRAYAGSVGASGARKTSTTEALADGATKSNEQVLSGAVEGGVRREADGTITGTGKGNVSASEIETLKTGDSTLTTANKAGLAGNTSFERRDGKTSGAADARLTTEHSSSNARRVDDNTTVTDTHGRKGSAGGNLARNADGQWSGGADAAYDLSRGRTTVTDKDGVKRSVTNSGSAGVDSSIKVDADGKTSRAAGVHGGLARKVETTKTLDDGTLTTGVGQKLDAGYSRSVDGDGKVSHQVGGGYGVDASRKRVRTVDGRTTTDTTTGGAKVNGAVAIGPDGKKVITKGGELSAGHTRENRYTDGNTDHVDAWGVKGGVGGSHTTGKGGSGQANIGLSNSHSAVTRDGDTTTTAKVNNALDLSGKLSQDKDADGNAVLNKGVNVGFSRGTSNQVVTERDGVKNTVSDASTTKLGGGYDTQNKGSVTLSNGSVHNESTVNADGSTTSSERRRTDSASYNMKDGVQLRDERSAYGQRDTRKLDEDGNTTLTSTRNSTSSSAGLGVKKDEDGNTVYTADAKAKATLLEQEVKHQIQSTEAKIKGLKPGDTDPEGKEDGPVHTLQQSLNKAGHEGPVDGIFSAPTAEALKAFQKANQLAESGYVDDKTAHELPAIGFFGLGAEMSAGYTALSAEANATGEATFSADQIKVKGAAGAKVTLIEGNAKIEAPVFRWKMGGEEFDVNVSAGVSAGVLAEANGEIELDISKDEDKLNVGVGGKASAFAGAKAGVEVAASLRWLRQPDYSETVMKFCKSIPGSVDDWIVDQLPADFWPQFSQLLLGTGPSKILDAKAGAEASAGIGGTAAFNMGLSGGKINVSGELNGTIGVGAGLKTDLSLDAVDGVRLFGVYAMKGLTWLSDKVKAVGAWVSDAIEKLQKQIDNYMEEKKAAGGFSGGVASVVDFFGDSVFGLW